LVTASAGGATRASITSGSASKASLVGRSSVRTVAGGSSMSPVQSSLASLGLAGLTTRIGMPSLTACWTILAVPPMPAASPSSQMAIRMSA
jgi:hypothetical protein